MTKAILVHKTIFIHNAAYTIEKGHASFGNVPYI